MTNENDLIPGVRVEVSIERTGEPIVLLLPKNDGPGQAVIHASVNGMDEDQFCALLRVVATTVEGHAIPPGSTTPDTPM